MKDKLKEIKELAQSWKEGLELEHCPDECTEEQEQKIKHFREAGEIILALIKEGE